MTNYRKNLIEVNIPLQAINACQPHTSSITFRTKSNPVNPEPDNDSSILLKGKPTKNLTAKPKQVNIIISLSEPVRNFNCYEDG